MQISVTFRHIEPSPALREYAEEKVSRIKKYLEEPIDAHVVLNVEKFRHSAEAIVDANGLRINVTEETEDMYSAIDMLVDTLEVQAKRVRDKVRGRKSTGSGRNFVSAGERVAADDTTEDQESRVIRTDQVYAKPMDLDEAVMQLDLSKGEFMVFTNRHTNRVNVLYHRKDGHYGLIETIV